VISMAMAGIANSQGRGLGVSLFVYSYARRSYLRWSLGPTSRPYVYRAFIHGFLFGKNVWQQYGNMRLTLLTRGGGSPNAMTDNSRPSFTRDLL